MEKRKYGWREFASDMRKPPNWITFSRIIGFFFLLLPLLRHGYFPAAFIVFLLFAATDYLDGELARRKNMVTWLGKGLDPVADKVLLMGTMLTLGLFWIHPIPGLLLAALESTLLVMGMVAFFGFQATPTIGANEKRRDLILGANLFGKAKAVLEIILISFVFFERSGIFQMTDGSVLFLFWAATLAAAMSILRHLGMFGPIPLKRHST